eukprot:7428870-Heterocapsa_arctica.AAC.1
MPSRPRKEVCIESTSKDTDIAELGEGARDEVEDCEGAEVALLGVRPPDGVCRGGGAGLGRAP